MAFFLFWIVGCEFLTRILAQVPDYETSPYPLGPTSFSCQGRPPGYYADLETGCRTYHVCDGNSHFTYICPRRTLFHQKMRICDHSYLVNCEESFTYDDSDFYSGGREELYESEEINDGFEDELSNVYNQTVIPETTTQVEQTETSSIEYNSEVPVPTTQTSKELVITPKEEVITPKYLRFTLKDFRSLFYIPEIENNSLETSTAKNIVVPLDRKEFMRFKTRPQVVQIHNDSPSPCPGYCNPKFFTPGTCHPCIMIK